MRLYLYLFLLSLPFCVNANLMYKPVNEKGNVTYSLNSPYQAIEIKEIDLPPAPTNEQILRTQQHKNTRKIAEGLKLAEATFCKEKAIKGIEEKCEEEAQIRGKSTFNDPGRADQIPKSQPPVRPAMLPTKPARR